MTIPDVQTGPIGGHRRRAAAVTMVRNECDIIELFIRINLRVFDHIHVVDHDSVDSTPRVLDLLQREGLPISIHSFSGIQQAQGAVLSAAAREVAATGDYAYVMPLDADEFLVPDVDFTWESLDALLGEERVGSVPWQTFVPVRVGWLLEAAPLHANFRPRSFEPTAYSKILMPAAIAAQCTLGPGSHDLTGPLPLPEVVPLPLRLQHVPVRSVNQLVQKALVGAHALSIKLTGFPGKARTGKCSPIASVRRATGLGMRKCCSLHSTTQPPKGRRGRRWTRLLRGSAPAATSCVIRISRMWSRWQRWMRS